MNLEINGRVIKILPEQTGQGRNGAWVKRDFVIETADQYPKKVCFSTWGDKTNEVNKLSEGEEVTVSFNVESREYNERWYTDLRAWRINKTSNQPAANSMDTPPFTEADIPPESDMEEPPF